MTKQLAPIEELAKQAIPNVHMTTQHVCLTVSELEQLRQAIIRDFVSTVEPVGEVIKDENQIKEIMFNAHHWTHILSLGDKLYTLSEWIEK